MAKKPPTEIVKARVLSDCYIDSIRYAANDVVILVAATSQPHEDLGLVDTSAEAVAYAQDELKATPIDHAAILAAAEAAKKEA